MALYARVSTVDQNYAMQISDLRRAALVRYPDRPLAEYVDTGSGRSGARLDRRNELMAAAAAGRIAVVLVWRFDRFARSTTDLVAALDNFRRTGVDFVSIHDGIDTGTASGKFVFTIFAALSEFEREIIRERVRAGLAARRARGLLLGRQPKVVMVDAARRYLSDGRSMRWTAHKVGVSLSTLERRLRERRKPPVLKGAE